MKSLILHIFFLYFYLFYIVATTAVEKRNEEAGKTKKEERSRRYVCVAHWEDTRSEEKEKVSDGNSPPQFSCFFIPKES
jgi:hypothetical protein